MVNFSSDQLLFILNNPRSICIFSILFSFHFVNADEENLFNNQELLKLVIVSFILMTFVFDLRVIL